jgi:flagellar export protein FliJ
MNFIFRLEQLFQLRAKMEQQRAKALARAVRDEQDRRAAVDAANAMLERCGDQIGAQGVATAGALRNLGLTVEAAARQLEQASGAHRAAVDAVGEQEQRFGEARRDRRVIERLRERRQAAFDVERSRAEQKEIDGHATQKHARDQSDASDDRAAAPRPERSASPPRRTRT